MNEKPAPEWIFPTIGIVGALLLAFAIGSLSGRGSLIEAQVFPSYWADQKEVRDKTERRAPCVSASGHDESDLCAQWRAALAAETSAYWTRWAGVVGIVSTFSVLAAVYMALEANRIARMTAARQLRAYVAIESIAISDPVVGVIPSATIAVKNFGQTPAHRFDITSHVGVVDATDRDPIVQSSNSRPTPSSLAPNGVGLAYPRWSGPWNLPCESAYRGGAIRMIVFGYIEYEDIFGIKRHTHFKVYRDAATAPGVTLQYPNGNKSS